MNPTHDTTFRVPNLHHMVRAGFVAQGSSLNRWCTDNGIVRQYAELVLKNQRNGPKAKSLRKRIAAAAGVAQ